MYTYLADRSSIYNELLELLNIENTSIENKLHFLLTSDVRMRSGEFDISNVHSYLQKLLHANKNVGMFDNQFLYRHLSKKLLKSFYFKMKQNR